MNAHFAQLKAEFEDLANESIDEDGRLYFRQLIRALETGITLDESRIERLQAEVDELRAAAGHRVGGQLSDHDLLDWAEELGA